MKSWRAYHDGPMSAGSLVSLSADEAHHLTRVLRLATGVEIRLFDGRGSEWRGTVETMDETGVEVRVGPAVANRVEPLTRLTLLQSTCRADRLEWVLQKGTELGVSEFRLVQTAASERVRVTPSKMKRWDRIIIEACKQSGRRRLPALIGPESLAAVAGAFDLSEGPAVVLHPSEDDCGIAGVPGMSGDGPVRVLVGPESGFEDEEIGLLLREGWQPAGLGPRTLRTETAGLVASAVILAIRGDLGP